MQIVAAVVQLVVISVQIVKLVEQLSVLGVDVPHPLLKCPQLIARRTYRLLQVVAVGIGLLDLAVNLLLFLLQFLDLILHLLNLVV